MSHRDAHRVAATKKRKPQPATEGGVPRVTAFSRYIDTTGIRETERAQIHREQQEELREKESNLRISIERRVASEPFLSPPAQRRATAEHRCIEERIVAPRFLAPHAKRENGLGSNRCTQVGCHLT